MTVKTYLNKIYNRYKFFLAVYFIIYAFFLYINLFNERALNVIHPVTIIDLAEMGIVTILLFLPSLIIFIDSLKRQKYAGGYVVAALIFSLFTLIIYWQNRTYLKKTN